MNDQTEFDIKRNKNTFRSLAEILLGFWERHEKEWAANSYDHTELIKKLKEQNGNSKGGDNLCQN